MSALISRKHFQVNCSDAANDNPKTIDGNCQALWDSYKILSIDGSELSKFAFSKMATFRRLPVVAVLIVLFQGQALGQAVEYTQRYSDDTSVTIHEGSPDLPGTPTLVEYCNTGVWISYLGLNYTSGVEDGGFGIMIVNTGDNPCTGQDFPQGDLRSARPAGVLQDNNIPSVTFYTELSLEGEDHLMETELAEIDFPIHGFITIENPNLELFSETNFGGQSFCFTEDLHETCFLSTRTCITSYIEDGELPFEPKSARIGCSSNRPSVLGSMRKKTKAVQHGVSRQANPDGKFTLIRNK